MIERIGKIFRKLDKRLMILICLTVIPINVLAILLSQMVVNESHERISASYESEFQLFMTRKFDLLDTYDTWYENFLSNNEYILLNADGFNEIKSISMVREANEALMIYNINSFFMLREKAGRKNTYMGCSESLYSAPKVQEIKKDLLNQTEIFLNHKWEIFQASDNHYLLSVYTYPNYDIIFGIDIWEELSSWIREERMSNCSVYISASGRELLCSADGIQMVTLQELGEDYNLIGELADEPRMIQTKFLHTDPWTEMSWQYGILQMLAWLSILILLLISVVIRKQAIKPLKIIENAMHQLEKEVWDYRIEDKAATDEFDYIYQEFNKMANDILESREKELQLYEVQLNNLKLQVNPHMLLNSLTMVYSLAETQQYQVIQKFVMNLVGYFRYCLRENTSLVKLESEMKFVENYLDIQKIRYPDELSNAYWIEEGLEDALIPPLLIQNFVENSIKYARRPEKAIEVLIVIRRENNKLIISINDTGKGIASEFLNCLNSGTPYEDKNGMKHIGVWNCRKRLELFYGKDAALRIMSTEGEGTQVWIELPYKV